MSFVTLGKDPVLSAVIERPLRGSWVADLEVDSDAAPTGKLALTCQGQSFLGTVVTSQSWNDRQRARVVAGAGGMRKDLGPAWYRNTSLRTVVKALLDAVGESLSPTSNAAVLARRVPAWMRLRGAANGLLDQVLTVFAPEVIWRHLPDGTVWIGVPSWPTVTTTAVVQDNRGDEDLAELAGDDIALDAGVTVLGRRVGFVRHRLAGASLRTEAWWMTDDERGIRASIAKIVERLVGPRLDIAHPWAARVVAQHADGTLDLVPDSSRVPSWTNVPICYGEPGVSAKVKTGARVFVEFVDGDPSKPHVTGWTSGSVDTLVIDADHIKLGNGNRRVACIGDVVQVMLPTGGNSGGPIVWTPVLDPSPLAKTYGTIAPTPGKVTAP
jgi:hypothetical protein